MNQAQKKVKEFHVKNGFPVGEGIPRKKSVFLWIVAANILLWSNIVNRLYSYLLFTGSNVPVLFRVHLILGEVAELIFGLAECNEIEVADGIADSMYVILGAAVTYNIPAETVFNEVHRSNMTKGFKKGVEKRLKKIYKTGSYSEPDIKAAIRMGRSFGSGGTMTLVCPVCGENPACEVRGCCVDCSH